MAMTRPLVRNRGMLAAIVVLLTSLANVPAGAQETAVRAILFYSPTCPHCHEVMTRDLPHLVDKYGEQLRILAVDSSRPAGGRMYVAVAHERQAELWTADEALYRRAREAVPGVHLLTWPSAGSR